MGYDSKRIGIIGMGYVGLALAGVYGQSNYIYCLDINPHILTDIQNGTVKCAEPELEELLKIVHDKKKHIVQLSQTMSAKPREVVERADYIFVTVGTPSLENGEISLGHVWAVAETIGKELQYRTGWKTPYIILKSTVLPGTTRKFVNIIEKYSKKKEGEDFFVVYSPEFLREGRAVFDLKNPNKIVLGGRPYAVKHMQAFFEDFYKNTKDATSGTFFLTNYVNAEMIKYANNCFLASKISFINQIANICAKIPGADVNNIAMAIGLDHRISPQFLRAGLGFGGSCFTKDLEALANYGDKMGVSTDFLWEIDTVNLEQRELPLHIINNVFSDLKGKTIAVLGLTFKPNTDDVRDSPALQIVRLLLSYGATVTVYDPKAPDKALADVVVKYPGKIIRLPSAKYALKGADFAVICTEWEEFSRLEADDFMLLMESPYVFDGRRVLDPEKLIKAGVHYYGVGYGNSNAIPRTETSPFN